MNSNQNHRDLLQEIAEAYSAHKPIIDEMIDPNSKPENPSKIKKLTEENEQLRQQLAQMQMKQEPFTYCFTDVNGRAKELCEAPEQPHEQDLRIRTALYLHPAPTGGTVPEKTFVYLREHLNEIRAVDDSERDSQLEYHLDQALQSLTAAPQPVEQQPAPTVQGEPVAEVQVHPCDHKSTWLVKTAAPENFYVGMKLYAAPQPAEQQPAPDVTELVEALEHAIDRLEEAGLYYSATTVRCRKALAAHRKGGK